MWHLIAGFVLRFRVVLVALLLAATCVMGFFARKVQLSYEFTKAIPTDNPKYEEYQQFLNQFGEDGNTMVVGVQSEQFFRDDFYGDYTTLVHRIQKLPAVITILSVPTAVRLYKDTVTGQLKALPLVDSGITAAGNAREAIMNLPFYSGLLYNANTKAYLMAIGIDKKVLNSADRTAIVQNITSLCDSFGAAHSTAMHYSGLPLIRTVMATKVQREMKLFILLSFALTAIILALFFRSFVAVFSSMLVVAIGVIWSIGTIVLCGYKISLLTGLIPPLIVVIGIPNCVYFLNKYHSEYAASGNKHQALITMVEKMGIVTLFTNLTAAIGFGVFYFTKSAILKEFGLVAGINLLVIFVISLILLPALFSFLPPPKSRHTQYMDSGWMARLLNTLATWVFSHRPWIYGITIVACIIGGLGAARLKSVAHIVDDLPKSDKVYQDLKFFEANFHGVMPLEIVVDAKKKYMATTPRTLLKIDSFTEYLQRFPEIGHPLAITEGIKFASQAYLGGDSASFAMPTEEVALSSVGTLLRSKKIDRTNVAGKLLTSFIDSTGQKTRISVSMADIGSVRLPKMLDSIKTETDQLFDTAHYHTTFTGTSIVFLEGSRFIIHSLRDSLILAFLMIFGCMIALFRSWRIVLISIIVNIVPLLLTAGAMGWLGVPLKPSTVLVFSVALGITVDVTIRFLVNFKQELATYNEDIAATVRRTIHDTGLSIIYTSLILIAGFGVFCLSQFDGTKSLGYLTSFTLLLAMITNLTLQPALLLWMGRAAAKKAADTSFMAEKDVTVPDGEKAPKP